MGACCSNPETEQLLQIIEKEDFDLAHQFFDSHREKIDPNYIPRGGDISSWTIVSKLCSKTYRELELLEKFLFSCKCGFADPLLVAPPSSPFNAIHLLLSSSALQQQQHDDEIIAEQEEKLSSPFVATNDDDDDDEDGEQNTNQFKKRNEKKPEKSLTSPLGVPGQPSSFVKSLTLLFRAALLLRGDDEAAYDNRRRHQQQKSQLPSRSQLLYALLLVYLEVNLGVTLDAKIKQVLDFFYNQFHDFGKEVIHQQVENRIHVANTVAGVLSPSSTIFHVLAAKDKSGEIFDHVMKLYHTSVQTSQEERQESSENNKNNNVHKKDLASNVEMTEPVTKVTKSVSCIAYMMNDTKNDDDDETPTESKKDDDNDDDDKRLLFDSEFRTPLMVACQSFNVTMAKKFVALKMGGDVRHASVFSANAFHLLATAVLPSSNERDPSSLLEQTNEDSAGQFFTTEQENAEEENIVTIAAKAAKRAREEAVKNRQETFAANQIQSAELTELLLGMEGSKFAKEAIDSKKYTPLLYAIQNQNRPLVKVLLEKGQVKKILPEGFVVQNFKQKQQQQQPNSVDEFSDLFKMLDLVGSFKQ